MFSSLCCAPFGLLSPLLPQCLGQGHHSGRGAEKRKKESEKEAILPHEQTKLSKIHHIGEIGHDPSHF